MNMICSIRTSRARLEQVNCYLDVGDNRINPGGNTAILSEEPFSELIYHAIMTATQSDGYHGASQHSKSPTGRSFGILLTTVAFNLFTYLSTLVVKYYSNSIFKPLNC